MRHVLLAVLLLGLISSCFAERISFYVSVDTGDDLADGSEDTPFASLSAALAAAVNSTINPDGDALEINIAPGVYTGVANAGLTYNVDTLIQYYSVSDLNSTIIEFACVDEFADTFFIPANNFVIDGNDNDENLVFNVENCKTGINFNNVLAGNETYNDYYLHVLYTNFGALTGYGIQSSNVYQVLIQDSGFNGTSSSIQAYGNGTGGVGLSQFEVDNVQFFNAGNVQANSFDTGKLDQITYEGGSAGAFILRDGQWEVTFLTVSDSTTAAFQNGGALNLQNANITMSDSDFTNCRAANGGAIYFETVDASLNSVTFTDCACFDPLCVGGAYAHDSSLITSSSLSTLTFTGNSASYGAGIEFFGTIIGYDLEELVFDNNTALVNGSCLDCCSGVGCVFSLNLTGSIQGSGNTGGENITCTIVEDSSFSSPVDNSNAPISPADNDDDDNNWWIWLIVIVAVAVVIAIIAAAAGFFVYQKKKKGQYAAVD